MKIVEVKDSSAVLKLGYDGENLFVQFVGGAWYKYFHVPEKMFERLSTSDSVGQCLNREIKPKYTQYEPCVFNPVS